MLLRLLKHLVLSFYRALVDTIYHDGIEHAGYLSFLILLALFPFTIFFIAIAGVIGQSGAGADFMAFLLSQLPNKVSEGLYPLIEEILAGPPHDIMTLAILGAVWTASSAVEGLRTILNRAFRVYSPPPYVLRRLLSIFQFLGFTCVVITGMLLVVFLPSFWMYLVSHNYLTEIPKISLNSVREASVIVILCLTVSMIYYMIPNTKQRLLWMLPGSVLVVFAWFMAGKTFTMYLQTFDQINLIYGSLAGLIAVLIFFYVISMIFIFGAEFNYHLSHPTPKKQT